MVVICITVAIVEPGVDITDSGEAGDNSMNSEESSSSGSGVVIGASVIGSLLVLGVITFLVVLFLIIRHKRKTRKYLTSVMKPASVLYNENGYVIPIFICI